MMLDGQVKNECGLDRAFQQAIAQWRAAALAGDLADGVMLITGRAKGDLAYLRAALERRRQSMETAPSPGEKRALAALVRALDPIDPALLDRVLWLGTVVEVDVADESRPGFQLAAALLEGVVVESGHGRPAALALRDHFHERAQYGRASDLRGWLDVLRRAGLPMVADAAGSPSARAEHESRVLGRYRQTLSAHRDLMRLHILAEDLPPLEVKDLLGRFIVTVPPGGMERRLQHLARSWTRFAVIGLPGGGKTTALEQLAATWAGDVSAPLPILVPLQRLMPDLASGRRISLRRLCEASGDGVDPKDVVALANAAKRGEAVLLLDGLDECQSRRGALADSIAAVIRTLPDDTGVIVTARGAASPALVPLALPVVELAGDPGIPEVADLLLDHVWRSRMPDAPEAWVIERRRWIKRARSDHPDVWRVPLLAITLTLIATDARDGVPVTRVAALHDALRRTVRIWETTKASDTAAWSQKLSPGVLLDSFASAAHSILAGRPTNEAVLGAVAARLEKRQGLSGPDARDLAQDTLDWWTARNGLLVSHGGSYQARVPLLAELGDALWAVNATPESREQWLDLALDDPSGRRESIVMAALLEPAVAESLAGRDRDMTTTLLAADAVCEGARVENGSLGSIVDHLAEHAIRRNGLTDEAGWTCARALATLPLPPPVRELRAQRIDEITAKEKRTIARALAARADLEYDQQPPSPSQQAALRACIRLPLPVDDSWSAPLSTRPTYINGPTPLPAGLIEVAITATTHLDLSPLERHMVREIAARAPEPERRQILAQLPAPRTEQVRHTPLRRTQRTTSRRVSDSWAWVRHFLSALSGTAEPSEHLSTTELWRLRRVSAVLEALHVREYTAEMEGDLRAFGPLIAALMRIAVRRIELEPSLVAGEAQAAVAHLDTDPRGTVSLLLTPAYPDVRSAGAPTLDPSERATLLSALMVDSDWLFDVATAWLLAGPDDHTVFLLWDALEGLKGSRRRKLAVELCGRGPTADERAHGWLFGDDPMLQLAAGQVIGRGTGLRKGGEPVLAHPDDGVRASFMKGIAEQSRPELLETWSLALHAAPLPSYRTCWECGRQGHLHASACASCGSEQGPWWEGFVWSSSEEL
jgi:hypothetical protein